MEDEINKQPIRTLKASDEIMVAQKDIVDIFSMFDDWADRYQCIIDLGRQAPPFPEEWKTDEHKLDGCQSQVWVVTEKAGDRLNYYATSDSSIVAGLIAMMLMVYSGRKPADILSTPPKFIEELDLSAHLSPTRSNGLHAMIQRIRHFAVDAMVKQNMGHDK
jgi:cysteine desulfuration protein SufE